MSDQHSLPPPETVAAIRAVFFGRLAMTNRDLIQAHFDSQSRSTHGTITPVSFCFWTSRTGSKQCTTS
jgi:hypothetical protein